MKKFLLLLLLAGSAFSALGQEQKLYTVEVRGTGVDPEAAMLDALSQAIQQAAGAIVDSQTLMKNDEIIQDKILTASNAIVKKYQVTVPMKKNRSGLYEIRIKAQVEQNLLKQKLIEHKIIAGEVEESQNIWAETVTREKNQLDMDAMIENTIRKIDFKRYLRFSLAGVNGTKGNDTKLYIETRSRRKVYVAVGLVCLFDSNRFQRECMPHLKKIFDSLPFRQRREFTNKREIEKRVLSFPPDSSNNFEFPGDKDFKHNLEGRKVTASWNTAHKNKSNWQAVTKGTEKGILLNVSPKYSPGVQQFVFYVCPDRTSSQFKNLAREKLDEIREISVSVCLLDKEGNELKSMTKRFDSLDAIREISGIGSIYSDGSIVISPEFILKNNVFSRIKIFPLSTVMDLEDFKEIKSFNLEVQFNK